MGGLLVVCVVCISAIGFAQPVRAWPDLTTRFVEMSPGLHPSARYWTATAYDSESDRVILFGGQSLAGLYGDTWAYDAGTNTWTNMAPSSSPADAPVGPGLSMHCMAYDSKADRVILFGGGGSMNMNVDTWAYDFNTNTWQDLGQVPPGLVPRLQCAMAYDASADRVVEFGGYAGGTTNNGETWLFDYGQKLWYKVSPPVSPAPRAGHTMTYDARAQRVLLYGGNAPWPAGDLWAYDYGSDNWTQLKSLTDPNAEQYVHSLAYDAADNLSLLIGAGVWAYDYGSNNWTSLNIGRINWSNYGADYQSSAYDSKSHASIVFGGLIRVTGTALSNHTWSLQVGPQASPGPGLDLGTVTWVAVVGGIAAVAVAVFFLRRRRKKGSHAPPEGSA